MSNLAGYILSLHQKILPFGISQVVILKLTRFFSDPENGDKEHQFWTVASILILVSIPTLPLLLIFTIKQKKTQKVPSQPPNNLQFHDNAESHQGISHPLQFHENDNEENNENSIQVRDHP